MCFVRGCRYGNSDVIARKPHSLTLHSFPRKSNSPNSTYASWVSFCDRGEPPRNRPATYVCSDHFHINYVKVVMYYKGKFVQHRQLLDHAIPTIRLPNNYRKYIQCVYTTVCIFYNYSLFLNNSQWTGQMYCTWVSILRPNILHNSERVNTNRFSFIIIHT